VRVRNRFFVVALCAALLGGVVALLLDYKAVKRPASSVEAIVPEKRASAVHKGPAPVIPSDPANAFAPAQQTIARGQSDRLPPASQMLVNMSKASDLRVFVESIKGQPGAALYIVPVLIDCGGIREKTVSQQLQALQTRAALDPSLAKRANDAAWLVKRCEGFTTAELSNTELGHVGSVARQRDNLYKLSSDLKQANLRTAAETVSAASKLLATGDPILIANAFGATMTSDARTGEFVNYVDGRRYEGSDRSIYQNAQQLAICQFTMTCDLRDNEVALNCALEDACFDDRESLIRGGYTDPAEAEKLRQLTARLLEILQRGEITRLMPVP
jgi:hypothetical protein